MNNESMKHLGIGLLAGSVIGGVFALLYAPMSGRETRELIKNKASSVMETLKKGNGISMDPAQAKFPEAAKK
jgi:gas vesicle protein